MSEYDPEYCRSISSSSSDQDRSQARKAKGSRVEGMKPTITCEYCAGSDHKEDECPYRSDSTPGAGESSGDDAQAEDDL